VDTAEGEGRIRARPGSCRGRRGIGTVVTPKAVRTVVVTDPAEVGALVAGVDRMRLAALSRFGECGVNPVYVPDVGGYASPRTLYEVAFSPTAASAPNFIVVTPMCGNTVAVRAQGTWQLPLQIEPDDAFSRAVFGILATTR
jgi:hypothetical protein